MTLTLYLLRHAKSDWSTGTEDHARPLNQRGENAAALVGRYLTSLDESPDLILCSSAERARSTAKRAAKAGGWGAAVQIESSLYLPRPESALLLLRQVEPVVSRVMVTSHQPFCSEMVHVMTSAVVDYPTAAVARIDLELEAWSDLQPGTGILAWLMTPRQMEASGPPE